MAKRADKAGKEAGKKFSDMTDLEKIEYRKQAFVRLIKPRVDKFCKAAEAVRACASINYISSDAQKHAVVSACKVSMQSIEQAYAGGGKVLGGFVLPSEGESVNK